MKRPAARLCTFTVERGKLKSGSWLRTTTPSRRRTKTSPSSGSGSGGLGKGSARMGCTDTCSARAAIGVVSAPKGRVAEEVLPTSSTRSTWTR